MRYFFRRFPYDGLPEASGYGITIIPGFGQWMLCSTPDENEIPNDGISVERVVSFLEKEMPE